MTQTGARFRLVARLGFKPLPPHVLISAAAHALFLVALVLLPSLRSRSRLQPDAHFDIILAPGPPVRQRPAAQASAPVSRPAPAQVKKPPAVKLPEKPRDTKPPKSPKSRALQPPAPPAPEPASGQGSPATGPAAGSGASSVAALELGGSEFAWYRASLSAAIHGRWRPPVLDGVEQVLEVRVAVDILADGNIRNLRVEVSSGVPSLDRSALRAVSDAAPLPPLPRSWREPLLPAGFVFRLDPEEL